MSLAIDAISLCRPCLRTAIVMVLLLVCSTAKAAELFPFTQELLLDARRRCARASASPILTVEANGDARIDSWCRTVPARVEDRRYGDEDRGGRLCPKSCRPCKAAGQCTPERVKADEEMACIDRSGGRSGARTA